MSITIKLSTNVVNVFPSTRRSDVQPSARYQTEGTYTEIIRHICDYKDPTTSSIPGIGDEGTFIITEPKQDLQNNKLYFDTQSPFEFCIYGYYFYIQKLAYILNAVSDLKTPAFDNTLNIYAYIDIESYKIGGIEIRDRTELIGRDETVIENDSKIYTGIKFTDTVEDSIPSGRHYIHLFQRENTQQDWKYSPYKNSIYKISNNILQIDIDGGVII